MRVARGPSTWVHGDLYGRHLLVADGALVGVIDWGDVHVGDPAIDLSIGWTFLPRAARPAFLAAYGPVDGDGLARARTVALHYATALLAYGRAKGDAAAEELGRLALTGALGPW
jgi:aminoglycoside phosphotransferase (APT) family kinase protein